MKTLEDIRYFIQENNVFGLESIYIAILSLYSSKFKITFKISDSQQLLVDRIKELIKIDSIESDLIESYLINNIFDHYYNNDNLIHIKEYAKFYNNKSLINHIVDMVKIEKTNTILDCNMTINSFLGSVKMKHNIDSSKLYGITSNSIINDIITISNNNMLKLDNINMIDVLLEDVPFTTKHFDIIFCIFPSGIHNIIHATCCNKIKKLKLRGTKMEPLLLQYIMMSLNKNGSAVLVIPDMLLFSDSAQMIQTRKYLLETFNVIKIVELNENNHYNKGVKSSILYFENKVPKNNIMFSKLDSNMNETHIFDMSLNMIQTKDYSLWYKHYINLDKPKETIEYMKISDIFDIYMDYFNVVKTKNVEKSKILALTKYYNDSNSIKIIDNDMENNKDYVYFLKSKIPNDFIYYYLEHVICTSYQQFTKGKMNQFDLTKIQNYSLPIVSKEKQTAISNYISMTNNIINDNLKQIEHYKLLKKYVIETIPQSSLIELDHICSLVPHTNVTTYNNNIIGIMKNSLNAGTVYLVNKNDILSSNSHYITITDNNYDVMYVYHIMKHMENMIKEAAFNTSQPNLNKSSLLALKIPSININEQHNIISFCNDFDNNINKYILANETIKSKNIFSVLCKL